MPNHKSCQKRLITSKKRRDRNRQNKAAMRASLKKYRELIKTGTTEEKLAQLPGIYSLLDRQARKGTIPRQRASRIKSRLALQAGR